MRLEGNARAMLAAERSALNTLQHLSGIATLTRRYVDAIAGTGAILLDTRKTIPGCALLDKYAARMGGAQNHRMRLDDGRADQGQSCRGRAAASPKRCARRKRYDAACRSRSRSTASTRSSRRSPPAPTGCCSTI